MKDKNPSLFTPSCQLASASRICRFLGLGEGLFPASRCAVIKSIRFRICQLKSPNRIRDSFKQGTFPHLSSSPLAATPHRTSSPRRFLSRQISLQIRHGVAVSEDNINQIVCALSVPSWRHDVQATHHLTPFHDGALWVSSPGFLSALEKTTTAPINCSHRTPLT